MVIGRSLFLSLFGEIYLRQGGDLYLFPKFHMKGFLFIFPESLTKELTQIYYIIFNCITLMWNIFYFYNYCTLFIEKNSNIAKKTVQLLNAPYQYVTFDTKLLIILSLLGLKSFKYFPYRIKIYTKFILVTWLKLVKFTELNISKF